MSKIVRKWVETDWAESGALRAVDIPYSDLFSIKSKLDSIKHETDSSIQLEELTVTPSAENNIGKIFTKNGDLFFLDELGNEIRLSENGILASITKTKVEDHTQYFVLSAGDIANGYVELEAVPYAPTTCECTKLGGSAMDYTVDYAIVCDTSSSNDMKILTWDPANAEVTTGLMSVLLEDDVIRINYLSQELPTEAVNKRVEEHILDPTDISNAYVDLTYEATPHESADFVIMAGSQHMQYTEDFIIKTDPSGQYKRVSWATADTGTGLESVLLDEDIIKITYTSVDKTQFRNTEKRSVYVTLTPTDISNKYVDIDYTPVPFDAVQVNWLGGSEGHYGVDFTVTTNLNGDYRRISWDGYSFDSQLVADEIIQIVFMDGVGLLGSIRITASDTDPGFLFDKLVAGDNISFDIVNEGGEEKLQITGAAGVDKEVEYITLDATQAGNMYIDLTNIPTNPEEAEMSIIDGVEQEYGEDFAVVSDGVDEKRVIWDVANGSVNSGISTLVTGDTIKVSYLRTI